MRGPDHFDAGVSYDHSDHDVNLSAHASICKFNRSIVAFFCLFPFY